MYEIYINDTKIVLLPSTSISDDMPKDEQNMVVMYAGKVRHLLGFIDMCEKTDRLDSITIHSMSFTKLVDDFMGLFKIVEAGGGVVLNELNEILFIHRRGFWDLPKGKMEKGETRRECAKREVMEETGITGVQLDKKILETRHTYRNRKNIRCIKLSHWYLMFTQKQKLTPQTEEDIEKTAWMSLEKFYSKKRNVYSNITKILDNIKTTKK